MAIHVALHHRTRYTYDRLVEHAPHVVRLRPAPHCRTPILSYSLQIRPAHHFLNWQQDPHGNFLARLVFPEPARELLVEVDLVAEMAVYNPFDFFLEPDAERHPFAYDPALRRDLTPFLEVTASGPRFQALCETLKPVRDRTIDFLVNLNRRIQSDLRYLIRLEPGVQSPEETLEKRSGSCRDSAWLLVQVLRQLGIAARFVSGYLIQLTPDVKAFDGPSGTTHDFTDLHAWAEAYLPGGGWIGLDPTSGLLAGEGHLPLACTPEPFTAAPVSGAVDPCESTLDHSMQVTRIYESPRVTKPYTESDWTAINRLAQQIDQSLETLDVRLTMGGEPTFVSIDSMDGSEWNYDALGPDKRRLADHLLRRLHKQFAPGGVLFHGQGKWYPGESLPRWAFACYWRRDGVPIWQDPNLLADEETDHLYAIHDARAFIHTLADHLDLESRFVLPAYEDVWYHLWKERRLPVNVDPLNSNLRDPEERTRLARIFEQGLGSVIGYALPLRRALDSQGLNRWTTGRWFLRPETLFLLPGDSPMGYRLPIDSLPWLAPDDQPWIYPRDLNQQLSPLPPRPQFPTPHQPLSPEAPDARRRAEAGLSPASNSTASANHEATVPPSHLVRTALCVEPRHGRLHVFLPPVENTEDCLDLIAAVEATAAALRKPVVLEGTPPPHDYHLDHFKITPDPGVIEVNLQPAHNWKELVRNTTVLYEEARLSRLGTEKFMLDGRHSGTGGGNHIVLGGPTPSDSPLLRRPDLLRSMVAFWHNHPSLSYLFSGLFLGPTSQHPRVDEARNDALYELEIAGRQLPTQTPCPPWLVDRVFRNLLVDVTGNTHRAEFCIDKLYPPDAAGTRLGLVELRAFEMPPHAQMSLAQHLVLRALIARFWDQPYDQHLVRWGTELHDRFMLPHFVWQDFTEILEDLSHHGMPFDPAWFAPHLEFRFPRIGSIDCRGVQLELRTALEPWHVLGEEPGPGGTSRYVDSSVERLQVLTRGLIASRHVVGCNGHQLPLHPTGTVGQFVAGVRYRAWQPPHCLHPTIGVHTPLVVDLVDTWNQRAIAGCTYHVMHPGGRHYDTFPVNAFEAESRRLARFSTVGHSPGTRIPIPQPTPQEFPFTLDLRRVGLAPEPAAA